MSNLDCNVVVITGAANGIGKELARRFAARGSKLALTDIDAKNLGRLESDLRAKGAEVYTEVFDVSDYAAVEKFSANVFKRFGSIDILFNNAGVISAGSIWETPINDWQWLIKVNVMGLVHGIKAFVPAMIKQDRECKVVNTASIAGLVTVENSPAYVGSKFAAVSLTEVLELQLQQAGAKVKAHVICPAVVQSDLNNCERHRPSNLYNADDPGYKTEDFKKRNSVVQMSMAFGMPAETAVTKIISGLENDLFYIQTHLEASPLIGLRNMGIMSGSRPKKIVR
jgi:NADP-dependent 3-hydroxy acid dehydrogenase YdfG